MEWRANGFTPLQLGLNLIAFLPMPVLLFALQSAYESRATRRGIERMSVEASSDARARRIGRTGRIGAIAYGASFAYFMGTTLYAFAYDIPDYATLWNRLGASYTAGGALMVVGGLLFAVDALRRSSLPRAATTTFLAGILLNLLLAVLPAPEIAQTLGSGLRNLGLVLLGLPLLRDEGERTDRVPGFDIGCR
jgi:hypothetical protein